LLNNRQGNTKRASAEENPLEPWRTFQWRRLVSLSAGEPDMTFTASNVRFAQSGHALQVLKCALMPRSGRCFFNQLTRARQLRSTTCWNFLLNIQERPRNATSITKPMPEEASLSKARCLSAVGGRQEMTERAL
jgi:hypothetical protein